VETILSEAKVMDAWLPDALIHRPKDVPAFMRQPWDDHRLQDFGPWRFSPDADPLQGQTEALSLTDSGEISSPPDTDSVSTESLAGVAQEPPAGTFLTQEQVDDMIREAENIAWSQGHAAAQQAMAADIEAERQVLRATATQLNALQSDAQQWQAPLKKLAIHIAKELVRGELRLDTRVIERLIQASLDALDQPAQSTLVQLGPKDMDRLRDLHLPGVTLELDDGLSEGSVRVKVQDAQVQDLMEHRLAQIARDILGDSAHGQLG
jgi:flagellar biosynthesis/type III secretory pathway protein FliH